ncbi:DUF11 domain-containing protein [Myxococcota bacterium]|nr:DUF11 domain-containing protein [Myxococcota bacterium]
MSANLASLTLSTIAPACLAALAALVPAGAEAAPNGPNLRLTVATPAGQTDVYAQGRYTLTVANIGNRDASSVQVTVNLPSSRTSPQVYVMGTLGARSAACNVAGLVMTCSLGTVRRNQSKAVFFDIALPVSSASLSMPAAASSNPIDLDPNNNTAAIVPSLRTFPTDIQGALAQNGGPLTADIEHCTGTGLVSFFQCTLFPSSISTHQHVFHADNTISLGEPGYWGSWSQNPALNQLSFTYFDVDGAVADFVGYGVDGTSCFEGITTFHPASAYNSAYSVCLQ